MKSSAVDLATYVRTPLSESYIGPLRKIGELVNFAPGDPLVVFGCLGRGFGHP